MGSFKNIALSMCSYSSLQNCFYQRGPDGNPSKNYLYGGNEVSVKQQFDISKWPHYLLPDLRAMLGLSQVFEIKEAIVHGHIYREGNCLVLNKVSEVEPKFALVYRILNLENDLCFIIQESLSTDFSSELNAYRIVLNELYSLVRQSDLQNPFPLAPRYLRDDLYVVNKYTCLIPSTDIHL